jgi:hypothetical protein
LHLTEKDVIQPLVSGKKLPPVKKLKFSDHNWRMGPEDVLEVWDFSRLESLKFKGNAQGWMMFIRSVQPHAAHLTRLKEITFLTYNREKHTFDKQLQQFLEQLNCLEKLHLDTFSPRYLVPTIAKIGSNLQILKLADHNVEVFKGSDLSAIVESCPKLVRLDLESNAEEKDVSHPTLSITLSLTLFLAFRTVHEPSST